MGHSDDPDKKEQGSPRLIRKYPNRRLYDLGRRGYITHAHVRELILSETPFEIQDSVSKEDISRSVLLLIVSSESDNESVLSREILEDLIRLRTNEQKLSVRTALAEVLRKVAIRTSE